MAQKKIALAYTVAQTNPDGTIVLKYLTPNHSDPRKALWALRREKAQHPEHTYRVFRYSGKFFDETELRDWIDENLKRA